MLLKAESKDEVEKVILDYVGILGWTNAAPMFVTPFKGKSEKFILAIDRKSLTNVRAAFEISDKKIQQQEIKPPNDILLLGFTEIPPQHNYLLVTCTQSGSQITHQESPSLPNQCSRIKLATRLIFEYVIFPIINKPVQFPLYFHHVFLTLSLRVL